ncbi:nucleotidyltransferase family protein [Paracoccus sp. M683]|nr:nucleotidyltransferase family protein [Paracoccus sp. M683]
MLFAAGLGTRMRPLTNDRPKPLITVGGQTLLDRALIMAREGGAGPVVVNTHYMGGMIADHLAGQDVAISDEAELILETGGGLRRALPLLGQGPVATLNPDVIWHGPNPIAALRAAWDGERMDALLVLVPLAQTRGRMGGGDFSIDGAGRISRKGDLVYAGAHMLNPDRLAGIDQPVFSLNILWDQLITEGRAHGLIWPGQWCDVGRPETIPLAEAMVHGN